MRARAATCELRLAVGVLAAGFALAYALGATTCARASWAFCAVTNPVATLAVALFALRPGPLFRVVAITDTSRARACLDAIVYALLLPALANALLDALIARDLVLAALIVIVSLAHTAFAVMKIARRVIAMTSHMLSWCSAGVFAFIVCALALPISASVRARLVFALGIVLVRRAVAYARAPSRAVWPFLAQGTTIGQA